MEPLRIIIYFTLLIGPLVFFHELGHLLMARRFGVKCREFAIGFGPKIASIHGSETEYSFRALPLGGFVRMLGMHDEDTPNPEDEGRSLLDQPRWQRLLIYLAGPLMNLLIPIPIFFLFHMTAPGQVPPVVGSVETGMPAAEAGMQPGDRITGINGNEIDRFEQLQRKVSDLAGEETTFTVLRGDDSLELSLVPEATMMKDPMLPLRTKERGLIGIHPSSYAPVVNVLGEESIAYQAGLRPFDKVVQVGETEISTFYELRDALASISSPTEVIVRRSSPVGVPWATLDFEEITTITLDQPLTVGDETGLVSAQRAVFAVQPGSPADRAGLARGDQITMIDGEPFTDLRHALSQLELEADQSHTLTVNRGGQVREFEFDPKVMTVTAEFETEREKTFIGVSGYRSFVSPDLEKQAVLPSLWYSTVEAFRDTIGVIVSLILGLFYLFAGQLDTSSLGGPMMIADAASQAARLGWQQFVSMMALISVNLGILNLLPIPGLDGGHMAVIGLESVKRGPLSSRTRQLIHFIGIAAIVVLMIFVFKNDVERYWSSIANWLNS
jgi:regulator of sigma E protease